MKKKDLEDFIQTYKAIIATQLAEKAWFANCHHVVLVAGSAKLPAALTSSTLYLTETANKRIAMLGPNASVTGKPSSRLLTLDQQQALVAAGYFFAASEKKSRNFWSTSDKKTVIEEPHLVEHYKRLCSPLDCDVLHNERILTEGLDALLKSGVAAVKNATKSINYSALVQAMQNQQRYLSATGDVTEEKKGLASAFYQNWFKQSTDVGVTFMLTEQQDIPLSQLLWLNNRYESAEQLLTFITHQAKSGKDIFLDPNSHGPKRERFGLADQAILAAHPTCQPFIEAYQKEQRRLAAIILPEAFYDVLQRYLDVLHTIGQQRDPWSFSDEEDAEAPAACSDAREQFFTDYQAVCNEEQQLALASSLQIKVPLRRSNQCVSANFTVVAQGIYPYNCLITQQMYLWAMLRSHRPETVVPAVLVNHSQAQHYNLGIKAPDPVVTIDHRSDEHVTPASAMMTGLSTTNPLIAATAAGMTVRRPNVNLQAYAIDREGQRLY